MGKGCSGEGKKLLAVMNMAHTKVKKVQEPSSVERGRRMRVTFARDMKVDEAMATPLQERLYASHPHAACLPPSPP